MPEHIIRLRGGWEWQSKSGESARLSLPIRRPLVWKGRRILYRYFHRPPIDPLAERLEIAIEATPGLLGVLLNGQALEFSRLLAPPLRIRLPDPLPTRNCLVLEVDFDLADDLNATEWGVIALAVVVRSNPI